MCGFLAVPSKSADEKKKSSGDANRFNVYAIARLAASPLERKCEPSNMRTLPNLMLRVAIKRYTSMDNYTKKNRAKQEALSPCQPQEAGV
jgi:hypothetical protein